MNKCYLGIDIGNVYTKGVIINKKNNVIASEIIPTEKNPLKIAQIIIKKLNKKIDKNKYKIEGIGTTGYARKLIGTVLETTIIKNEILTHTIGTLSIFPKTKTIIESGGNDIKIIYIKNKRITNYSINTLYKKIDFNMIKDLFNNKKINSPIVLQGGMAKNKNFKDKLEIIINKNIICDNNSQLMGAIGAAILAKKEKVKNDFNFEQQNINYYTKSNICNKCNKKCEIIYIYNNNKILNSWGYKCLKNRREVNNS